MAPQKWTEGAGYYCNACFGSFLTRDGAQPKACPRCGNRGLSKTFSTRMWLLLILSPFLVILLLRMWMWGGLHGAR